MPLFKKKSLELLLHFSVIDKTITNEPFLSRISSANVKSRSPTERIFIITSQYELSPRKIYGLETMKLLERLFAKLSDRTLPSKSLL